jgi:hypothetical protein
LSQKYLPWRHIPKHFQLRYSSRLEYVRGSGGIAPRTHPRHYVGASCQLHAPETLSSRKRSPSPFFAGECVGFRRGSKAVKMSLRFWKTDLQSPNQLGHCTDWAALTSVLALFIIISIQPLGYLGQNHCTVRRPVWLR